MCLYKERRLYNQENTIYLRPKQKCRKIMHMQSGCLYPQTGSREKFETKTIANMYRRGSKLKHACVLSCINDYIYVGCMHTVVDSQIS